VHAVSAWVEAAPTHLWLVRFDPAAGARTIRLVEAAGAAGIALERCSADRLTALAGTRRHQGVVADAPPFPYAAFEALLAADHRLLLLADQIQDPQNLGALIRSGDAAGAGGLLLPKRHGASVTAAVEMSAAGAAAFLPICRVPNVHRALRLLQGAGMWVVGLSPAADTGLYECEVPGRVVLVVGGEAGMRPLVERSCDLLVSIPMQGRVQSLNLSVAAAVALFELRRRWMGRLDRGTAPG
jgi:23S rRNA (guanosine2251-2'-O)-methyltransferase